MNSPVSLSRPLAAMFRRTFALLFSAALCSWSTAAQLATDNLPRQEIAIPNFEASGWILDLGGGCRGTIGRMKPDQVVAIDISARELKEAPNNFLKIVMDASDLQFLDRTFHTVTAFFSLMYMPPSIHRKVFAEAYRVLQTGGRWLIWDAVVPTVSDEPEGKRFTIYLRTKLPSETVEYGYSIARYDRILDPSYYAALAKDCGFEVVTLKEQGSPTKTFFLELRRP
jgi:ubiquinone/menaquinone biosynthesis C-methylase UbiE